MGESWSYKSSKEKIIAVCEVLAGLVALYKEYGELIKVPEDQTFD